MKKIKLTLLGLLLAIAYTTNANPVDANIAQKVAENFYAGIHSSSITDISLAYTERDQAGSPVFYVFNITTEAPQKGFIIISAEDATHPVIGFSDEGSFVIPENNNNVSFWMQERKNEITTIRAHQLVATTGITNEWTTYTANTKQGIAHKVVSTSVGPLCGSSWNQSPFYNAYCPGGSVTGCVATAMAQIMRYWKYPSIGTGTHCYSDQQPYFSENYGQQCAEFDTSHYLWSAMQLSALGDSNNQIAKLMYDCGVSVDMDYTPQGSGSQVMGNGPSAFNSFTQYFGYDADSINTAYYDPTQQTSWIALLESELNKHRPMQFQGFDVNDGGHSWVCDGYYNAADTTVHMNWGWGGQDNGWYAVNSLNPTPFDFTYNIAIIYGIQPPPNALGVATTIAHNTTITVYPNPSTGVFNFILPDNNTYQIKVYNVLGEQVNNSTVSSSVATINIGAQAKGVYIYKLYTEKGIPVSTGRLVVE